jgi:hypothetical protein
VRTLWTRTIDESDAGARYLYLRGSSRRHLPPYGLSDVIRGPSAARRDLLLVDAALARAGAWLGTLPARLALEQEDAVRTVASRCGYSVEAVGRAFRARYWSPAQQASTQQTSGTLAMEP